jgi:DNA-binding MarR family transcriptional regulator
VTHGTTSQDDLVAQWDGVVHAVQAAQRRIHADLERAGIGAQWFGVLQLLTRTPGERLPMSKLARDLAMTSGGFTKLADRMAREGLIDRRGSAADRRVIYAALTDRGRELAEQGARQYRSAVRTHVLGVLDGIDLDRLTDLALALDAGPGAAHIESGDPGEPAGDGFEISRRDPASPERRRRATPSKLPPIGPPAPD